MSGYRRKRTKFLSRSRFKVGLRKPRSIGYFLLDGSASDQEVELSLLTFGSCSSVVKDVANSQESSKERPQFSMLLKRLVVGDELVLPSLDCLGLTPAESVRRLNLLKEQGIFVRTLDGKLNTYDLDQSSKDLISLLSVLLDVGSPNKVRDQLVQPSLNSGFKYPRNLGGRPRTSSVKEQLVLRLRADGFSYRSIREQTSLSLSTIRRIINDANLHV